MSSVRYGPSGRGEREYDLVSLRTSRSKKDIINETNIDISLQNFIFSQIRLIIGISPPKNDISPETIDIYPNKIGIDSNVFEICRRVGKALTSLGRHLPSDTIIRFSFSSSFV